MLKLAAAGLTDVGRKRTHNEDSFAVNLDERLVVVADGMGGHAAGEVAAKIAVDTIEQFITETSGGRERTWPYHYNPQWRFDSNRLAVAVEQANSRVMSAVAAQPTLKGMGTTLVAAVYGGAGVSLVHVGDSRAYLFRDHQLKRLTNDHSWVNEQIVTGILTEEEARTHPLKNVITRALGGGPTVVPDLLEMNSQTGDRYLFCSDGLTTMVADDVLSDTLGSGCNAEEACRRLVDAANKQGGLDNVTVVILDILEAPLPEESTAA